MFNWRISRAYSRLGRIPYKPSRGEPLEIVGEIFTAFQSAQPTVPKHCNNSNSNISTVSWRPNFRGKIQTRQIPTYSYSRRFTENGADGGMWKDDTARRPMRPIIIGKIHSKAPIRRPASSARKLTYNSQHKVLHYLILHYLIKAYKSSQVLLKTKILSTLTEVEHTSQR